MRRETVTGLSVCIDCAMAAANGTREARQTAPALWYQLWRSASRRNPDVALVLDCGDECDTWFSMSRCDWCGSRYGGDRHAAALISCH